MQICKYILIMHKWTKNMFLFSKFKQLRLQYSLSEIIQYFFFFLNRER